MATALAAVGALVMSGGLVMLGVASASADDPSCVPVAAYTETINHPAVTHDETVTIIDSPAWTETIPATEGVHYSWNGGKRGVDDPPTIIPPNASVWTPQGVEFDPHLQGEGEPATWYPADATTGLHVTGNSPENASWFYYVPPAAARTIQHPAETHQETRTVVDQQAWTEIINHPAIPCPDQPGSVVSPLNQERMSCDMGVEQREGTQTTTFVWNAETRTYDPLVGEEVWGEWEQVRDLTTAEALDLECIAGEESVAPKPDKQPPVAPKPEANPPVVLGTEAVVPTQVHAGMTSLPGAGASTNALLAQLLVGAGLILLVAGGWVGVAGRDYGKHHI